MPELPYPQRSPEWFEARKGKVTASLAAACLGLDKNTSRQKAWRIVMGTEKERENEAMAWGKEFEDKARESYQVETGNVVDPSGFWILPWAWPENKDRGSWLGASPDGLVGTDGLVEIKCPGTLPTAIPLHHRIQCLTQLLVTGRQWCDYYSWTHNGTFLDRVRRSGLPGLLRRLEDFYLSYVITNTEPPRKKRKKCRKSLHEAESSPG